MGMLKTARTTPKRGRPVDAGKRDQILAIATKLFMEQGFSDTSMDQIAKQASISKLTLYNRFPDKNVLFMEVITNRCQRYVPDTLFDVFTTKTPREAIHTVGRAVFSLVTSDDAMRLYRMMAGEATKNSKLTGLFYEGGPRRLRGLLTEKMRYLHKTGALSIPDAEAATDIFISLFKGSDIYMRMLLNIGKKPSTKEIEAHIKSAVEFFIRAHKKG